MHTSTLKMLSIIICLITFNTTLHAQNSENEIDRLFRKASLLDLRGTNIFDIGAGSAVPNNDLPEPKFEIYFKGGYKRYITPHFYIGADYHKFNLANTDAPNNGFMSLDLNAYIFLLPYKKFTPYVFFGTGLTASNFFEL